MEPWMPIYNLIIKSGTVIKVKQKIFPSQIFPSIPAFAAL